MSFYFCILKAFPVTTKPVTHNIQIRMAPQSPTFQQHQYQTPLETPNPYYGGSPTPLPTNAGNVQSYAPVGPGPASYQQMPEPKMYTGGNIPSRSFKLLQNMTPHPHDGE